MLMPMVRVFMAKMRVLLQTFVAMAAAVVTLFVAVVLFPLAPNVFLFSKLMVWVSQSSQFLDSRVVLMLKNTSHGS
jgi:hypothetical protein